MLFLLKYFPALQSLGRVMGCLALIFPSAAYAFPLEGNIGLSTLPTYTTYHSTIGSDVELRLKGTPWGIGFNYISFADNQFSPSTPQMLTGWGQYQIPISKNSSVNFLLGGQHLWGTMATTPNYQPNNFGALIGASYLHRWDNIWFRVTPSYTYFFQEVFVPSGLGIPWAEVGYTYGAFDFSLGLSIAPVRISFAF